MAKRSSDSRRKQAGVTGKNPRSLAGSGGWIKVRCLEGDIAPLGPASKLSSDTTLRPIGVAVAGVGPAGLAPVPINIVDNV